MKQVCEDDIVQIACENFTIFTTEVQLGTNMIRFWGRKVKDQGRVETKYDQKSFVENALISWEDKLVNRSPSKTT